jgi:pilus assembly protein CpaF
MFELVIETPDAEPRQVPLQLGRSVIGKGQQSDILIDEQLLSRRHCALEVSQEGVVVEDLASTNGTFVDEAPVERATPLPSGSSARLGKNVHLRLRPTAAAHPAETGDEPLEDSERVQQFKQEVQRRILEYLDIRRRGSLDQMSSDEIRAEARKAAETLIDHGEINLPSEIDRDALLNAVVAEAIGLGPIEPLLEDEAVSEIMVNGPDQIYVERKGRVELSRNRFADTNSLMNVIDRIVTPLGRRIDEGNPMIDARLRDGSRVNAIIPPLALNGPTITIRKFSKERLRGPDLVNFGSMTFDMMEFLRICVQYRRNVVVSGGTGSGKTTTLNVLSDFIPEDERIVTIEDSAELSLSQDHVVPLESRPPNVEGTGEVTIRDLVRNSLRMRPDRIVVGECRGGEALDMLQAMNTGHDGSLTTGHANSPRDMLSRLEVMIMMAGMDLPSRAIRE